MKERLWPHFKLDFTFLLKMKSKDRFIGSRDVNYWWKSWASVMTITASEMAQTVGVSDIRPKTSTQSALRIMLFKARHEISFAANNQFSDVLPVKALTVKYVLNILAENSVFREPLNCFELVSIILNELLSMAFYGFQRKPQNISEWKQLNWRRIEFYWILFNWLMKVHTKV